MPESEPPSILLSRTIELRTVELLTGVKKVLGARPTALGTCCYSLSYSSDDSVLFGSPPPQCQATNLGD